jgi:pimeloyl-ACP methyl ester carboxylesterase
MLSYHRAGAGPPLVLIHGIGSRWQVWRPLLPVLHKHFDVIAIDLPGFGASPVESIAADVPAFATRVVEFVAELGLTSAHVAGSSLGGGVALEIGRRGFARSVTAFAPVGFWSAIERRWCQATVSGSRRLVGALGPTLPRLAARRFTRTALFGLYFGHPGQLDVDACLADAAALRTAPGFAAACSAFAGWRFDPATPGALAGTPVTVAWGSRDLILPRWRQAARAQVALPQAQHVRLLQCGHLPFSDDPDMCVQLITATAARSHRDR